MNKIIYIRYKILALITCFWVGSVLAVEIDDLLLNIEMQPDSIKVQLYNKVSKNYYQNDIGNSLKYATKAESIAIEINDFKGLANSYRNIGTAYFYSRDNTNSIKYYSKSLEIGNSHNDNLIIGKAYNNLGMVYKKIDKSEKALECYGLSLEFYKMEQYIEGIINTYNNIAAIYTSKKSKDYHKAIEYRKKALKYVSKDNSFMLAVLNKNIATSYYYLKDYETTLEYLNRSLEYTEGKNYLRHEVMLWRNFSFVYRKLRRFNKAFEAQEKWTNLKDSLNFKDSSEMLRQLQVKLEVKEKNQKIKILEEIQYLKDVQLTKEKLFRKHLILLLIFVSILIVAIFVIMLFINRKNSLINEKNKELELANSTKNRFFSIIAHDLKNPFTTIYTGTEYLEMFYDEISDNEKRKHIIELHNSSTRLLKLIEDLFEWSKSQTGRIEFKQEKLNLCELIDSQVNIVNESAKLKNISIVNEIKENHMIFADKNMIMTVVRNLISNSVKFTHNNGKIVISNDNINNIRIPKNQIFISIIDNGVGFPTELIPDLFAIDSKYSTKGTNNEIGSGLGLLLCKDFIDKHNGIIGVHTKVEKGSSVYFTIPLFEDFSR